MEVINPTVNVIHLSSREDREASFKKEFDEQGITYKVWEGQVIENLPFVGICRSHKAIVREAKRKGLSEVVIAEDDLKFSHPKSWQYFLENKPESYDLYLSMIYSGTIDKENKIRFGFAGLTLYMVHERFYDFFLQINEKNNIDRELGRFAHKFEYKVCPKFCCYQMDGYSNQKKKYATYGHLLEGREMFKG